MVPYFVICYAGGNTLRKLCTHFLSIVRIRTLTNQDYQDYHTVKGRTCKLGSFCTTTSSFKQCLTHLMVTEVRMMQVQLRLSIVKSRYTHHKLVSVRFIWRLYISGCLPGRCPLLPPWCQHKSSEELGTRRRRLGGSRRIELSP